MKLSLLKLNAKETKAQPFIRTFETGLGSAEAALGLTLPGAWAGMKPHSRALRSALTLRLSLRVLAD